MNRHVAYLLGIVSSLTSSLSGCTRDTVADPGPDDITPDAVAPPTADYCEPTDPRSVPVDVVATPEAGETPYLTVLDSATTSIDVQVYMMGYGGILDRLKAKAAAGVDVKVMLDQSKVDTNQKYFDQLGAAGVQVKWSDPAFTFTHSKYFVVDDAVAVLSTGNYSKTYSIDRERNFVATVRDDADIRDLVELFDADWAGTQPAMDCTRLVISPINARQRILDLIAGATTTLDIESMQFADSEVRSAVADRIQAGIAVRVLLADANWIDANASAATFLANLGVTARWIPHLHSKVIVADRARAYVGSENLSFTSLDKNREVGVIVTEASSIAPLLSTFDKDWAASTEF